MPDRELLLERLERLAIVLDELMPKCAELVRDALALLKEQEKPNGKCVNECECWDSAYERGKQDALKEQEEHEKKICKEICDFIRGCSTDTYADKEFVCHEIQKCFMKGR